MWEYCEDGFGPPGLDRYEELESWSIKRLEKSIARAKDEKGMADLMSLVNLFVVGGARAFEAWRTFKKGRRTSVLGLGAAVQNTVDRSRFVMQQTRRLMRQERYPKDRANDAWKVQVAPRCVDLDQHGDMFGVGHPVEPILTIEMGTTSHGVHDDVHDDGPVQNSF